MFVTLRAGFGVVRARSVAPSPLYFSTLQAFENFVSTLKYVDRGAL